AASAALAARPDPASASPGGSAGPRRGPAVDARQIFGRERQRRALGASVARLRERLRPVRARRRPRLGELEPRFVRGATTGYDCLVGRAETTLASGGAPSASSRRFLLVVGAGHVGTYPLPDGRDLVLGRDPSCEVPLAHPKISRRHARLIAGPTVAVEDLGSTNGIRVGGKRIESGGTATLRTGESFELGPFVAVVLEAPREPTADAPILAAIPIFDPTPAGVPAGVTRVAQSGVNVLLRGETGAGKEVLAQTLHELSGRSGPFVPINCAALSESLLESELFGHERGAFTGATAAKPGLFEVGAGGTVLLDEIGDLPASLQAKLLRALETPEAYRLGGV